MNTVVAEDKVLSTADLAAAAETPVTLQAVAPDAGLRAVDDASGEGAQLAPLFLPDAAKDFRTQWDSVQISFVDDPKEAVRKADELVAQVMKSLAQSFSVERAKLEGQIDQSGQASTENLRVALRRYRSFFQRLLSL
jgi:hypothetical protein